MTYGVDLDGGPDRAIHGLGHGVRPLPNFRLGDIALFEIPGMVPDAAGDARMAPPPVAYWISCGEHGGRRDRQRSFRSVVCFPARAPCATLATAATDAIPVSVA